MTTLACSGKLNIWIQVLPFLAHGHLLQKHLYKAKILFAQLSSIMTYKLKVQIDTTELQNRL